MQWLTIGVISALVIGLVSGFFLALNSPQNYVPTLASDKTVSNSYSLYRSILAGSDIVSRGYHELPSPIDKMIPGHLLTVDKRLNKGRQVLIVREFYEDPTDSVFPVAVIFDSNSDGIFSLNEGYLLQGDPLFVGATPLQVVAKGIEGAKHDTKESQ